MLPEVRAESAQGSGSDNEQRATKARNYSVGRWRRMTATDIRVAHAISGAHPAEDRPALGRREPRVEDGPTNPQSAGCRARGDKRDDRKSARAPFRILTEREEAASALKAV